LILKMDHQLLVTQNQGYPKNHKNLNFSKFKESDSLTLIKINLLYLTL
jgi:hypothetical protein